MNKKIDDIKFESTNDEMVLEDFVLRSEPEAIDVANIMQKTYAKVSVERRHLRKRHLLRVAAVVVPLLLCALWSGIVWMERAQKPVQQVAEQLPVMRQIVVGRNDTLHVTLPDGSRVIANSRTELSYPSVFRGHTRDVSIKGEGYFEVTKNEQLPFTVASGNISVRVLGTKFNFRDYATDEEAVVDLAEGSVAFDVAGRSDRRYQLRPNQRAVFSKTSRRVYIGDCVATNASQWTDGTIVLDGKSMKDIALQLSRSYNADVEIKSRRAAAMHFYGTFARRSQSLKDVLDALASTGKIRYRMVDERSAVVY